VNHAEEPSAPGTRQTPQAAKAWKRFPSEYEALPSIHTIEDSEQKSTIIWGTDNIFKSYLVEKGRRGCGVERSGPRRRGEYFTVRARTTVHRNNGVIAAYARRMASLYGAHCNVRITFTRS